jgi:hypothetical protein
LHSWFTALVRPGWLFAGARSLWKFAVSVLLVGVLPFVAFGLGFSVAVFMYTFLGDVIFGMFGKCAHFVIMNRVVSAVGQTGECTITVRAASQAFPASQASHALHVSGQARHGR